jgi:circadian clock protein KaiC
MGEEVQGRISTGIEGLDAILRGGYLRQKVTLLLGSSGVGKSLFGYSALASCLRSGGKAIFFSFEESVAAALQNAESAGLMLRDYIGDQHLFCQQVDLAALSESGAELENLEGLAIRVRKLCEDYKPDLVFFDSFGTVLDYFSGGDCRLARVEISHFFSGIRELGITCLCTGVQMGWTDFVADAVIELRNEVHLGHSLRTVRVSKCRGTDHSSNMHPFVISTKGIRVLVPLTQNYDYSVSQQQISSGIKGLDDMIENQAGFFKGSVILVAGGAGSGKTTLVVAIATAAAQRGDRVLYVNFEESVEQVIRDQRTMGHDLTRQVEAGVLRCQGVRSDSMTFEQHLLEIEAQVLEFDPQVVVLDPVTSLLWRGNDNFASTSFALLTSHFKERGITSVFVFLDLPDKQVLKSGVSSFADVHIELEQRLGQFERTRLLGIHKVRGLKHSNQVREFMLTDQGVELIPVYLGSGKALIGSERLLQERIDEERDIKERDEFERRNRRIRAELARLAADRIALEQRMEEQEFELKQLEEQHSKTSTRAREYRDELKERRW